jgi:hypothetical protein
MRTRIGAATAALTLAMLGVSATAPAAAAPPGGPPGGPNDEQQLLFLRWSDSDPWSDNLTGALFTDAHSPIVPGDSPVRRFYAFNNTGDRAELYLVCTITPAEGSAGALAGALDILYNVNTADSGFRTCEGSPDPFPVTGRSTNAVDVQLSLPGTLRGTTAMNDGATYSITVTLRQTPRGNRPPRVLGTQTLIAEPGPSNPSAASGTADPASSITGTSTSPGGNANQGKPTPTKTTKIAAAFRGEDGAVTESIPLIAGLLLTGALMAGFRRRRPQAD